SPDRVAHEGRETELNAKVARRATIAEMAGRRPPLRPIVLRAESGSQIFYSTGASGGADRNGAWYRTTTAAVWPGLARHRRATHWFEVHRRAVGGMNRRNDHE